MLVLYCDINFALIFLCAAAKQPQGGENNAKVEDENQMVTDQ
jgi:hypothetical protein